MPGESGGNVYVSCMKLLNGPSWTVLSEGGRGGPGQHGGNGRDGRDGEDKLTCGWRTCETSEPDVLKQAAEENCKDVLVLGTFGKDTLQTRYESIIEKLDTIPGGVKHKRSELKDGRYHIQCERKSGGGSITVYGREKRSSFGLERHELVFFKGKSCLPTS